MENEKKLSLADLRNFQKSINVFNIKPASWNVFEDDIPDEIIDSWKNFIDAKKSFNQILKKHNIEEV